MSFFTCMMHLQLQRSKVVLAWSLALFWEWSAFGNELFGMKPNAMALIADRVVCTDRDTSDIAIGIGLNVS